MSNAVLTHGALEAWPRPRADVVSLLKRQGPSRAESLAAELGVTASAVRHQLSWLIFEGYVTRRDERYGRGRPQAWYSLSRDADELFPDISVSLASAIVSSAETDLGSSVRDCVDTIWRNIVRSAASPGEQVVDWEQSFAAEGYVADVTQIGRDNFIMTVRHCPVVRLARQHPGVFCDAELEVMRECSGYAVTRVAYQPGGPTSCVFGFHRWPVSASAGAPEVDRLRRALDESGNLADSRYIAQLIDSARAPEGSAVAELFEVSSLGAEVFDHRGRTVRINNAQRQLLGIERANTRVNSFNVLTDPAMRASEAHQYYHKAYRGDVVVAPAAGAVEAPARGSHETAGKVPFPQIISPAFNADGEVEAVVAITLNVGRPANGRTQTGAVSTIREESRSEQRASG